MITTSSHANRPDLQIDPITGSMVKRIEIAARTGLQEELTFNSRYLYKITHRPATIWKIDPETATLVDSVVLSEIPGGVDGTYNGLAFDGRSLWAAGFSSRIA